MLENYVAVLGCQTTSDSNRLLVGVAKATISEQEHWVRRLFLGTQIVMGVTEVSNKSQVCFSSTRISFLRKPFDPGTNAI
jgi:hypothetical protein